MSSIFNRSNVLPVFLILVSLLLSGCTPKYYYWNYVPYEVSAKTPSAELINGIKTGFTNDKDFLRVSTPLDSCEKMKELKENDEKKVTYTDGLLFMMNKQSNKVGETIRVQAGVPIGISYYDMSYNGTKADRYCSIFMEVTFKPDGKYMLLGGFHYEKSSFPLVAGKTGCRMLIVDMQTMQPVPFVAKRCQENKPEKKEPL